MCLLKPTKAKSYIHWYWYVFHVDPNISSSNGEKLPHFFKWQPVIYTVHLQQMDFSSAAFWPLSLSLSLSLFLTTQSLQWRTMNVLSSPYVVVYFNNENQRGCKKKIKNKIKAAGNETKSPGHQGEVYVHVYPGSRTHLRLEIYK